ncbi:Restriction endonuclease BglII [Chryseobacterium sp. MOF25P]|uniref:BglII/BstYI family type II restriction endonuclease n=1 Tax=unclassified Chryseobacterium TaxID=2593645 RepID=UPI000805994D|nr:MULTISPECIES: BglII/BstYI family type II restriction endonuclease [unclassified Chryseobacterium]OBW42866.1 Restriction endonuclease BglII [Chryseobacterium sp. MOF25P]OBW44902.1 Restriction endonuclease BglII [Chryseobacterium sp. BGARF1]
MNYTTCSFRHAEIILQEPRFSAQYNEITAVLTGITDDDIITKHESYSNTPKSISRVINDLLKERFLALNWSSESPIFQHSDYTGETWRLDFAKADLSIEVAFNHSTVIAWNLIKPVLASELNHVQKAIQTKIGIVITATQNMKVLGGFDGAVGTFEKFVDYLPPLQNLLTVPLLINGLEPPTSFKITHCQPELRKTIGQVIRYDNNE